MYDAFSSLFGNKWKREVGYFPFDLTSGPIFAEGAFLVAWRDAPILIVAYQVSRDFIPCVPAAFPSGIFSWIGARSC